MIGMMCHFQPAHPHPHQKAESLIDTFTARGSSAQLPPHTSHLQQQLRLHRNEARKVADATDQLFTRQELTSAKKRGRNTTAGGGWFNILDARTRRPSWGRISVSSPFPSPGSSPSSDPSPSSPAQPKHPRKWCSPDCSGAWEPSTHTYSAPPAG